MNIYQLFILCCLSCLPILLSAQSAAKTVDRYLELVEEHFSPEQAYQTTEYVAQYWRLPGNPGFDSSIYYVERILKKAGYQYSDTMLHDRPSYRIERYPMRLPAWEPLTAHLQIAGTDQPLLNFATNRNMIAINSFATPESGVTAEAVYLPECSEAALARLDVKGKVVLADCWTGQLFSLAVLKHGALGVLAYRIPPYNQPEKYPNNIPFSGIAFNTEHASWAINLSYAARETLHKALEKGPLRVRVQVQTRFQPAEELTLIAHIPGAVQPKERLVFSAHVQEPGANDNASGVGALAEMARTAAALLQDGAVRPARTLTFLWGDEIRSTRRYIEQDEQRRAGIRWGISLDMVGEDTDKTGGTFLIEKMPDPSAIWTRGEDKHSEWGATPVSKADLQPHYFNDVIEFVCRQHAARTGWVVNTNPYEGGSDHQPFLDAGIPGLLFWHFTDVFYHTDADRIDKVSAQTLSRVGVSALAAALWLTSGTPATAKQVLAVTEAAARKRLQTEQSLSRQAIGQGAKLSEEKDILQTWTDWYTKAVREVRDIPVEASPKVLQRSRKTARRIDRYGKKMMDRVQR